MAEQSELKEREKSKFKSITIYEAIQEISNGKYLLPSFQREYVWKQEQVESFFDSVMREYPFGSMLFWKVKGKLRHYRFYGMLKSYIEWHHRYGEQDNSPKEEFYAILDGQQRLTSLYLGLCGSYAYHIPRKRWTNNQKNFPTRHLYLNITKPLEDDDRGNKYEFRLLAQTKTNEVSLFIDDEGKWFKVSQLLKLYSSAEPHYKEFEVFYKENNLNSDERDVIDKFSEAVFEKKQINFYEEIRGPDTAVDAFIRMNSGGTKLSYSDILKSILIANWEHTDAKTELNKLVDDVNKNDFSITHDYVLKAILYLYHDNIKFKISNFSQEFVVEIENKWEGIRDAIESVFDFLKKQGFGRWNLTSVNATLPILYYIYHRNIYRDFSDKTAYKEDRAKMRRWLLRVLLRKIFGRSSDSVLKKCRSAFTSNFENEKIKDDIREFPEQTIFKELNQSEISDSEIEALLRDTQYGPYAFFILALLYPNVDYKNNKFHMDHLHPEKIWKKEDADTKWQLNSVLNLQMLDANENETKQDKSLKDWVENTVASLGVSRQEFLKNRLIPHVDLEYENHKVFIEKRRELLKNELKKRLA